MPIARNAASDPTLLRTRFRETDLRVPTRGDKEDFISAITRGTAPMTDAEIGHRTCSLGQIGHIAIRRGTRFDWDPARETFPTDSAANTMLTGRCRTPRKSNMNSPPIQERSGCASSIPMDTSNASKSPEQPLPSEPKHV